MNAPLWKQECDDLLKHCRTVEGLSFDQTALAINARFGTSFSRCACIGRAKRIGIVSIPKEKTSATAAAVKHGINQARSFALKQKSQNKKDKKEDPVEDLSNLRCAEVEPLNVTLLELGASQCKFPYGEGPFTFCGHASLKGLPYCAAHQPLTSGGFSFARKQAA